jgi:hypothetical protein
MFIGYTCSMKLLKSLFGARPSPPKPVALTRIAAPLEIASVAASAPFQIVDHLRGHEGLPILDWRAVEDWLSRMPSLEARSARKADCQRAWLLHLRDALGGPYELHESAQCFVLAPYTNRFAALTLAFVARTRERIAATLEGLAQERSADKEILIVFTDPDAYYRYISQVYPDDGEFSFSSGMFLHAGCPHFVTVHDEMHTVERVIAHEMTHASLAHLRIPLWLNEGIAVNTEDRLMGRLPKLFTPAEMREKHLAFWGEEEIQEFWSGKSFYRPDDGCMLSYDLAQILVEIFAPDWPRFRAFVQVADYQDSGDSAAREHLDLELGDAIASLFEQASSEGWQPHPEKWSEDVTHTPE